MQRKFIRLAGVKKRFGFNSDSGIYANVELGLITKPVKISIRASGWPDDELDEIIDARIAGASNDEIKALVAELHDRRKAGKVEEFAERENSFLPVGKCSPRLSRGAP